ncbi:hypothetical protein GY14_20415 [Delftia tsuruhatensis]|nr:hypothetical protein GY14_20415 [Delftia tsuruhatensis]
MARRPRPEEMLSTLRGTAVQPSVAARKAAVSSMGASSPTRMAWAMSAGRSCDSGAICGITPALLIRVTLA